MTDRASGRRIGVIVALVWLALPALAAANELWIAPTYQQDTGGLGIGSNIAWPATAVGASRFAVAVPNDLQTFQSAKVVVIPQAPGGAATLNVIVCAAQNADAVGSACAGPFGVPFTGVPNQLAEVEIGGVLASRIGTAGASYLAIVAYTTPTTTTDHLVGLRFVYAPKAPQNVAGLGANVFTDEQLVQTSNASAALVGVQTSNSGLTYGVQGQSNSGNGIGVYGKSTATSGGASYGVYGDASSNQLSGTGVFGVGSSYGLYGQSNTIGSTGVFGKSLGTVGLSYGVFGDATANTSSGGIGVFGTGNGFGLYGQNMSTGTGTAGVWGDANLGTGVVYGVGGQTNSTTTGAAGVIGKSNAASGLTYGVEGAVASASADAAAVRGDANASSGSVFGGYFRSASNAGTAVLGWAPAAGGTTYGVRGQSDSGAGTGVFGYAPGSVNTNRAFGVRGQSDGVNGIGAAGIAPNGGPAAYPSLGMPVGVLGSAPNGGYGIYSIGDALIDGNASVGGSISASGAVGGDSIVLAGAYFAGLLPPCGPANTRENNGKMILTAGGAGDDAHLFVCIERADNTFGWKQVF